MDLLLTYAESTGRALALVLADWLKRVLPGCGVETWAPDGVAPGEPPSGHRATCICVTPEALAVPRLYYAAGAAYPLTPNGIAVPVALDLEPEDLGETPLSVLQATVANRAGLLELAATLRELAAPRVSAAELLDLFEGCWPDCEERLRSVPGTLPTQIDITVATDSFLQTFPYGTSNADGMFVDTLVRTLTTLSGPGSPALFPSIDYAATRLFDMDHERWIAHPKLLSRVRSKHLAFVDRGLISAWGDSPWLLAATIRSRVGAGRSVAQDPRDDGFIVAP